MLSPLGHCAANQKKGKLERQEEELAQRGNSKQRQRGRRVSLRRNVKF